MFNINNLNLKDIFYNSSDAIFILDKEWRIVAMNHAAEEVTGWSNAEVASMRLCTEIFICFGSASNQLCDEGCPKQSVMLTKDTSESFDVKVTAKSGHSVILPGVCVLLSGNNDSNSYAAVIVKNELEKQQLEERLMSGERLDPLTQLYHRQYFDELFHIEAKRAQRHGGFVTLLMIDIERLREINQRLGTKSGDEVLKGIGKLIRKTIREVDIAGRYGDDEYIILLYGVDEIKAQGFIQRLRENLKKWNNSNKLSIEVKLNMNLVVLERDFDGLLERMKDTIDEHKGEQL
ncbi:MAG: diguanylate cyclase [Nitrospirae bacterium]|nr:diguanylate cyclase [Nitrospirota bacterium]